MAVLHPCSPPGARPVDCVLCSRQQPRWLRLPLPAEYFSNDIFPVSIDAMRASELLLRGHGRAAVAVGWAVAAHTEASIRDRVAVWAVNPTFPLPNPNLFQPSYIYCSMHLSNVLGGLADPRKPNPTCIALMRLPERCSRVLQL